MSDDRTANSPLAIDRADGVLRLTKTNRENGYGMSGALLDALTSALTEARGDPSLSCVIIDAEGGFHDAAVVVMELGADLDALTKDDSRAMIRRGQALCRLIAGMPVPVITLAAAGARGGGVETMLRSDMVYCTDAARFSLPEVRLGFVPGWGGVQWGARMMGWRKAQEFILTGKEVDGREAEAMGLVTASFPDEAAMRTYVADLCERLRFASPTAVRLSKDLLRGVWETPLSVGEDADIEAEAEAMATGDWLRAARACRHGELIDYRTGERRLPPDPFSRPMPGRARR